MFFTPGWLRIVTYHMLNKIQKKSMVIPFAHTVLFNYFVYRVDEISNLRHILKVSATFHIKLALQYSNNLRCTATLQFALLNLVQNSYCVYLRNLIITTFYRCHLTVITLKAPLCYMNIALRFHLNVRKSV